MKNFTLSGVVASALILASLSANVFAASISLDTRSIDAGVNNSDYRAAFAAQSSGISSQSLGNMNGAFTGSNTISHLKIDFSSLGGSWGFQIAPDAGFGGSLYLDNQLLTSDTSNLWWGYAWNNTSELLTSTGNILLAGNHLLEGFWAEDCCNGSIGGRFTLDGGITWKELSVDNLNAAAIPAPEAIWLLSLGMLALMMVNHKKSTSVLKASI